MDMQGFAFTCLRQIEMSRTYGLTEWREDLKGIMKRAGFGEQPVVFLFSDTQVGNSLEALGRATLRDHPNDNTLEALRCKTSE